MRLIFVRHGEPDYRNDCLTPTGVMQAKSTAERLRDEDIKTVYSSPMGRAVETASYTASVHGLEVKKLDFMHEINWGDLDENAQEKLPHNGHPWTAAYELLTGAPEYIGSSAWPEHPYFKNNICMQYYTSVSEAFDSFLSEHGLLRKNGLYECTQDTGDTIALFAHGGSGAIMFAHVFNLPFPFVLASMPYGVCSVSIIRFEPQNGSMVIPQLELFNDMGHIENFRQEKLNFDK